MRATTRPVPFRTQADEPYGRVRRDDAHGGVIAKVCPPKVASTAGEQLAQAQGLVALTCPDKAQLSGREKVILTAGGPHHVQKTVSRDHVTLR